MAVEKKTIRHVPFGNAVTSLSLRLADLDIEYNMKRIEDVLIGEFSQTKATVGGDPTKYFEAAEPVDQYDVVTWSYAQANFGQGSGTELTNHTNDTSNPHNVTKAQVGLNNVINEAQALPSDLSSHESSTVDDNVHGFVTGAQLVEGTDPEERVRNSDLIGTFKQHEWTAKVHDDLITVAFEYNGSVAYSLYYPFAIDYYKGTDMLIGPSSDYSLQFEYSSQNNGIHFVNGQNPDVVDMSNFDDTGWNTVNLGAAYDDGLNVTAVSVSPIYGYRYFGTDVGADGSKVYRYAPDYDDDPTVLSETSDGGLTDLATDPVVAIESNRQNRSWILFPNNLYKMDSGFALDTEKHLEYPSQSLEFDGDDDYTEIGTNPGGSLLSSEDFTVECFVLAHDTSVNVSGNSNPGIFGNGRNNFNTWELWVTDDTDGLGSFRFELCGDNKNRDSVSVSLGGLNLNEWYHLAGTYRSSDGTITLYVNGEFGASTTYTDSGDFDSSSLPVVFAKRSGDNSRQFPGRIVEARIWKGIEKTQTQIQNDMNKRLNGDEAGLVGYWPLDGDVEDYTSNNNDGTINGDPEFLYEVPQELYYEEDANDMYLTRDNEPFIVTDKWVTGYDADLNEIVQFSTVKDNVGIRVDSFGYIYTLQKTAGVVYIAKYDRSGNKEWEWSKDYNLSYTFDMNAVGYFYLVTDDDMTVVSPRGNIVDQFIGIIENEIVDTTGIDSNYSVKHIQVETGN